jgi:hypothetical protein
MSFSSTLIYPNVGRNGVQWRDFVSGNLMNVDEKGVEQPKGRKLYEKECLLVISNDNKF